jgi:predicted Rossmann fold flavoprotein
LLDAARSRTPRRTVRRWLTEQLPERLAETLLRKAGAAPSVVMAQVTAAQRASLARWLLEAPLAVTGTLGYAKAEVTAGGVPLTEIDARTMESRVVPGLYLVGEMLDVDGRIGGFNFQWAWSSGVVAGRALSK